MAWLSGYSKRKPLTLTGGPSGAQTDFQLSIAVSYEAAMQGDFDDLRFTQSNGTTLVDAWAEVIVTDTSATVWVEFPSTPANTVEQDYYMYYGNGSAVSDWDGPATFLQYHGVATSEFLDALTISPSNIIYEGKCKRTSATHNIRFGMANNQNFGLDDTMGISPVNGTDYSFVRNEGIISYESRSFTWTIDTYYRLKMTNTGSVVIGYIDGTRIGASDITTNLPDENLGLGMNFASGTGAQDWSFARKYASGPPTYAFGSEESAPTAAVPIFMHHHNQFNGGQLL